MDWVYPSVSVVLNSVDAETIDRTDVGAILVNHELCCYEVSGCYFSEKKRSMGFHCLMHAEAVEKN